MKAHEISKRIRCAIYTRKSTDEGLDMEFNSLDAQREAAEAYIVSQRSEGWECLPARYDDGGFTGGNVERPALQRLLADVQANRLDCVMVYKVDRLSRSLLDFSKLMDLFDKHKVSFVSVTQQFNTTHSMGRLTLNILLSFAQFEREIIAERTKDKMSAARRKGKWVGGIPVLGYNIAPDGGKLLVNPEEAAQARVLFSLYLESGKACWRSVENATCAAGLPKRGHPPRDGFTAASPTPRTTCNACCGTSSTSARLSMRTASMKASMRPLLTGTPGSGFRSSCPTTPEPEARRFATDIAPCSGTCSAAFPAIAELAHVSRARITQIMDLTLLAPDVQEALLFLPKIEKGRDRVNERMLRSIMAEPFWGKQRELWNGLQRQG